MLDKTNLFQVLRNLLGSARNQFVFTPGKKGGRSRLHPAAAYPLQQPRGNSRAVFSFLHGNHYKIVIICKTNFRSIPVIRDGVGEGGGQGLGLIVGRGPGVGAGLGVGLARGVGVGLAVEVGVAVAVAVAV